MLKLLLLLLAMAITRNVLQNLSDAFEALALQWGRCLDGQVSNQQLQQLQERKSHAFAQKCSAVFQNRPPDRHVTTLQQRCPAAKVVTSDTAHQNQAHISWVCVLQAK